MNKPFQPHKPEKTITAEITVKEANLLKCIRMVSFGKLIVHKANNTLVRVETFKSTLLDEKNSLL